MIHILFFALMIWSATSLVVGFLIGLMFSAFRAPKKRQYSGL